MKKWFVVVLILTIIAFGLQYIKVSTSYSLPELYKQTSPAVVWIGAECDPEDYDEYTYKTGTGIKWQGTGFLVSEDGLIATAGHIVEDTDSFKVMFQDGTRAKAGFVHMENIDRCDVGFIKITWIGRRGLRFWEWLNPNIYVKLIFNEKLPRVPIKNLPYFHLDVEIEIGEDLIILGYPWGLNNGIALTQGVVSLPNRKEPYFGTKLVVHTDVASYPGNSGSPVIDMDGECVGILIGGAYGCDNFSIVTPAQLVKFAMQKALAEIGLRDAR